MTQAEKKAIIIGATSGMGYQIALILAAQGWKIGAAGRRENRLNELKSHFPDKITTKIIDSHQPEAEEKLRELIDEIGGMNLFLNSAGIGNQNIQLQIGIEVATELTNTIGFTRMVCTAFNYYRERENTLKNEGKPADYYGDAQIAAITSIAGTKGLGVSPSYSATKRFQSTYLQSLNQLAHIQKLNITFTDIRPGFVTTALLNGNQHYPMQMSVEYAANKIVNAILKKKRIAIIDWKYAIMVFFWRLIPGWLWIRLNIQTKESAETRNIH